MKTCIQLENENIVTRFSLVFLESMVNLFCKSDDDNLDDDTYNSKRKYQGSLFGKKQKSVFLNVSLNENWLRKQIILELFGKN